MSNQSKPNPYAGEETGTASGQKPVSPRRAMVGVGILALVAIVLAVLGILHRSHAFHALAQETQGLAAPTVVVAPAQPGALTDNFVLPGNVTAYTDAPIYARTDGYLVHWYFDIGARVNKGDLLALIDTPELDQQLAQGQADLATAEATANNARIQAQRYTGLVASDAVSRQDTDTYVNQAAATAAAVHSAQANVQRLKEMQSFEKVYAPFDGVVTARNIDAGDQNPARLYQCPADLFADGKTRHEDPAHLPRTSREGLPGHAGADRGRHRSVKPHAAGGGGRG
jgi:multidrug efflux pump subunit AcrA (membrane-fusion protein)